MATAPIESVFSRAWQLLTRNPVIIVPGIIIGIIVGVLNALLTPTVYYTGVDGTVAISSGAGLVGSGLLRGLIGLLGYLITQGLATAMGAAAWQRGTTTLYDATRNLSRLLPTAGALLVLVVLATVLALPTLGLALLAYYLFTLYAFPAAVVGNASGFSSVQESFRLTVARFVPTLIVAVLIFVIALIGGIVAAAFHFVPFLGPIVGSVITQIVVAYAMLVIVGEYLTLRAAAPPGAYAPTTGAYPGGSYSAQPGAYPPGPSTYSPGPTPYAPPAAQPTNVYTPPPTAASDLYEPPAPPPPTSPPPPGPTL